MSKRNAIWAALVVIALVAGWIAGGWLVGVVAAAVVLVTSEVVERTRRRRIAAETGRDVPSLRGAIASNRKKR